MVLIFERGALGLLCGTERFVSAAAGLTAGLAAADCFAATGLDFTADLELVDFAAFAVFFAGLCADVFFSEFFSGIRFTYPYKSKLFYAV